MDPVQDPSSMMMTPAEQVLEWNQEYEKLTAERDQVFQDQVIVARRLADMEAKLKIHKEKQPIL